MRAGRLVASSADVVAGMGVALSASSSVGVAVDVGAAPIVGSSANIGVGVSVPTAIALRVIHTSPLETVGLLAWPSESRNSTTLTII